jgi:predicted mannosyl-3-phosphoglycerate phosphatase (HAD superfamily)
MGKTNDFMKGETIREVHFIVGGVAILLENGSAVEIRGEIINKEFGFGNEAGVRVTCIGKKVEKKEGTS